MRSHISLGKLWEGTAAAGLSRMGGSTTTRRLLRNTAEASFRALERAADYADEVTAEVVALALEVYLHTALA